MPFSTDLSEISCYWNMLSLVDFLNHIRQGGSVAEWLACWTHRATPFLFKTFKYWLLSQYTNYITWFRANFVLLLDWMSGSRSELSSVPDSVMKTLASVSAAQRSPVNTCTSYCTAAIVNQSIHPSRWHITLPTPGSIDPRGWKKLVAKKKYHRWLEVRIFVSGTEWIHNESWAEVLYNHREALEPGWEVPWGVGGFDPPVHCANLPTNIFPFCWGSTVTPSFIIVCCFSIFTIFTHYSSSLQLFSF